MKLYFFSNKGCGTCYTVMATSIDDAKKHVLAKIEIGYQYRTKLNNQMFAANNKILKAAQQDSDDKYKEEKDLDARFTIEEYDEGQIVETEYS